MEAYKVLHKLSYDEIAALCDYAGIVVDREIDSKDKLAIILLSYLAR